MTDSLFKAPSKEQSAQEIADHLPSGRAWDLKNDTDSNLRKLIRALSASHSQVEQKIEEFSIEIDIDRTLALLNEWERSVSLPDVCLNDIDDIEDRRDLVKQRLRRETLVTLSELQALIDHFFPASDVTLYPGYEYFNFEYTFEMSFWGDLNEKFVLVAEIPFSTERFEYDFEFPFENGLDEDKIICLLNEVIPANVYLLIVNKIPIP